MSSPGKAGRAAAEAVPDHQRKNAIKFSRAYLRHLERIENSPSLPWIESSLLVLAALFFAAAILFSAWSLLDQAYRHDAETNKEQIP